MLIYYTLLFSILDQQLVWLALVAANDYKGTPQLRHFKIYFIIFKSDMFHDRQGLEAQKNKINQLQFTFQPSCYLTKVLLSHSLNGLQTFINILWKKFQFKHRLTSPFHSISFLMPTGNENSKCRVFITRKQVAQRVGCV